MTGFGRACVERDGRELTVEFKSVNHRYLDVNIRLPRHLMFLEEPLRAALARHISRGHVDVYVNYRNWRKDALAVTVDEPRLAAYLAAARAAAQNAELPDDLTISHFLRMNDIVVVTEAEEDQPVLLALANETAEEALAQLRRMREQEGEALARDLTARVAALMAMREEIAARAPLVTAEYHKRLQERLAELLGDATAIDPARLAMEVAVFADRASVDEELVRLQSHGAQFDALLAAPEPVGRKLDFLVQEMNREFNTIGSKANDARITELVIQGKAELEKVREQVQNIE